MEIFTLGPVKILILSTVERKSFGLCLTLRSHSDGLSTQTGYRFGSFQSWLSGNGDGLR